MVLIVVVINTLVALLCVGVAWQLWQLRQVLRRVTNTLLSLERSTHAALNEAPEEIYKTQLSIYLLREEPQYRRLQSQIQQIQQVLKLLSWSQTAWRRLR